MYYNLNKVSLSRGGSYIDSPKLLKNKKATINPKNNDDKFFQYPLTVALNYEKLKKFLKEYQKLSLLLINRRYFPHIVRTGKKIESNDK